MDRISRLPDSIICHILSFLPTRNSVATGILSRRWRHLWKDVQVLDIDDKPFGVPELPLDEGIESFFAFVDTVLYQRRVHHIRKFRLTCNLAYRDPCELNDDVTRWILAATGPHLQELYLSLYGGGGFCLPDDVFTCTSLVSLVLIGEICWHHFPSVDLPSLKNLELNIYQVDPNELLPGCPVLETFKLNLNGASSFCAIHMPSSLKSLIFEEERDFFTSGHLEIVAPPPLEYLRIKIMSRYIQFLISNFPNMVESHLDIFPDAVDAGWVLELLKALSSTKLLVLKVFTAKCLLRAPAVDFPEFRHLLRIELDIPYFNSRELINLLHNCHMLQVLVIHDLKEVYLQTLECSEPSVWIPPTTVPNCVISHLKIFEFAGYEDSTDEHAFTAYLLQRGLVLKTMTIHPESHLDLRTKYDIVRGLSARPRGSSMCQLKFD